jgi:hypothetical protein
MKINKTNIGIEFLILLVLLSSFVTAFGVSYGVGRPLQMYAGESREDYIILQNRAGDIGDVNARVEIMQGKEIVTLKDGLDVYLVPYGSDAQVNFTIKIPENAKYNDTYIIKLSATTVPDKNSGGMGFAMGSGQRIEVIVVPKPGEIAQVAEENPQLWGVLAFIGLAIIIIAVVLVMVIRKRTKNNI